MASSHNYLSAPLNLFPSRELCSARDYMLLLCSAVLLAVIAANVVAILLAATIASRRMHHD